MHILAVSFIFGSVLWASALVGAPILIHLMMRTKPRHAVLPTLRFLVKSHKATTSRMRLRNILLLLLRMVIILLIALLIAMPFLPDYYNISAGDQPVALVAVIDTSASMTYRSNQGAIGELGRSQLADYIRKLPPGSKVAVVTSQSPADSMGFLPGRKQGAKGVSKVKTTLGAKSLAGALSRARRLLKEIDLPVKQLIVVTDMTKEAWRSAGKFKMKNCTVAVIDASPANRENYWLGSASISADYLPLGAAISVKTSAQGSTIAGDVKITLSINGEPADSKIVSLKPNQQTLVEFLYTPDKPGVYAGTVELELPDGMRFDNTRHFAFTVGKPSRVGFVRSAGDIKNDTAFLMKQAISPTGVGALDKSQSATLRPSDLTAERLSGLDVVVIANLTGLSAENWRAVAQFVKSGKSAWLIAGDMTDRESYNSSAAAIVMPARLGKLKSSPKPVQLANPDFTSRFLQPFGVDSNNPPLRDLRFYRYFELESFADDAEIPLRFEDTTPALIARKLGAGQVVFWNFSPARDFSNMGQLAGQLIILADQTKTLLVGTGQSARHLTWGQRARFDLSADLNPQAKVALLSPGRYKIAGQLSTDRDRFVSSPVRQPGVYEFRITNPDSKEISPVVVNVHSDESDEKLIPQEKLREKFPATELAIVRSAGELTAKTRSVSAPVDLLPLILVGLFFALAGESYFANRFYKMSADNDEFSPNRATNEKKNQN